MLGEQADAEDARGAEARHRRARPADRGDPAGQPARGRARRWSSASRSTCWRSPPRRRAHLRRRGERRAGRPSRATALLLRRLVRNLLENARRYGGDGPIEIVRRRRQAARAVLEVSDRGPGVPADERERIFEPFYRRAATRRADAAAGSASPWCATSPAVTAAPWFALRQKAAAAASGSTCRRRSVPMWGDDDGS